MRRALRTLMTLAVAGALGVAGAGAAQASAYGASPISPFSYQDDSGATKSIPYGCALIHSVIGEGINITAQTASVDCAGLAAMRSGLFCDVKIVFTFTSAQGRTKTLDTQRLSGCRTLGIKLSNEELPADVDPGKTCVRLFVNGETSPRASSCHIISA
ncbi:hypothetical protein SAMN06264364_11537 [Quadrisphaera granulorum]|uniref:Uncharacterized protein n=1 Tax=Quadrisphaera granulorum TaxID=317664 RepID=A0A316A7R9_9ACTN|nr:hypothetical protein [Quadrisphaera granulorum]PWJ53020.1 hypothetical protein BXY45_11537 [Quadrisphaera granulorum]SZE97185.1 hypothetical protein SAMN06264364_11537 [Quadrisphaera granulorum]